MVVGVRQEQGATLGRVDVEHVAQRVGLVLLAPGAEPGVLGVGPGVGDLAGVVEVFRGEDAGHGVGLVEVDQVGEAAQRGRLLRADAAGTVVVQGVADQVWVVRRPGQCLLDDHLRQPADGADRRRVPHGTQQCGLEEAGGPEVLRVGVDDLDQDVSGREYEAFGHGFDLDGGEEAAVVVEDAEPVVAVEVHALFTDDELGLVDVLEGDGPHEVLAQERLEPDELGHRPLATAGLDVAGDVLGARGGRGG